MSNERLNLACDIHYSLTENQRIKMIKIIHQYGMGITYAYEMVNIDQFKKITKNNDIINKLYKLKRMTIRLVS